MAELITEWKLDKYFYNSINDPAFKEDLETYKTKADAFVEKYKGKISGLTNEEFLEYLDESDVLDNEAEKVIIFLALTSSLDTQDQVIQKENAKLQKTLSDYREKFLFIDEEYRAMGFKKFLELADLEMMQPYKNLLRNIAINLQYFLSEAEEKVIIKLATAYSNNLYEELSTSFEFTVNDEKLTEDEVRMLRENQDRETRLEAFKSLASVYQTKQNQIVLGNLYSTVCKDNVSDVELRKYATVMTQRNLSEEVSDETVNTLLKNVAQSYSLYHAFLNKKAEILKLNVFETQDVFAPYPSEVEEEKVSFEKGWEIYKRTIEKVDPMLASFSEEMLNGGRISVYPKQGKTSGAYAQYTKSLPEFVLLNWANTYADVTTLAHELGHAFHGALSKRQKAQVYSTPLILAETASIFNETLMFETLLEMTEDQDAKKKLICNRLDDIFGTIFRQVAYVRFEKRCHEAFHKNEPLTYDDYNNIWCKEMESLYGPSVRLDKSLIKHGWSSIPHIFHTPFYCYTYAFGNIISLNLFQNYKNAENKNEFINKYHEFLAAGGSDTPENLLNDIFDMKFDDSFYSVAFMHIQELLQKLND
jgi:oligoendopeptidase F